MARFLHLLGTGLLVIGIAVVVVGHAMSVAVHGPSVLLELLNPFNLANLVLIVAALAPGLVLRAIAARMLRSQSTAGGQPG